MSSYLETKWYTILMEPTLSKDKVAGPPYHYQVPAVDDLGALRQAQIDKKLVATSKQIELDRLIASVTLCEDC